MIDHGKTEYALYVHLKPGSVRVHVGDEVKSGDVVGKLGLSGNSTERIFIFTFAKSSIHDVRGHTGKLQQRDD